MPARLSPRRLLAVGGVVAVAVAAVYVVFFTPDSPDEFKLEAGREGTAAGAGVAASDLEGTYEPTPESQVGYRVREKLGPLPASQDAVGRTNAITGSVVLEEDGDTLTVTHAAFEVDVTKVTSDEARRDNRMRTMGLETDKFPTSAFRATEVIEVPAGALTGAVVQVRVTGDLTIHGTTRPVTIPLDVQLKDGAIHVVGTLTFPFADFGMTAPNVAGFVTVESEPTLEMNLVLARAAVE